MIDVLFPTIVNEEPYWLDSPYVFYFYKDFEWIRTCMDSHNPRPWIFVPRFLLVEMLNH